MTLNNLRRIMGLVSILLLTMTAHAATITATWDFANVNPSSLSGVSIEGTQAHVTSTVSDVSMYVIAKYGKFAQRTSDAQLNAKTALRIPVTSNSDVVTVTSDTGYHNYTVGGVAATADVTAHTATSAEVTAGYVVIYATASSYLQKITVKQNNYTATSSSSSASSSTSTTVVSQNYYKVTAGSVSSLLAAITKANSTNTSASSARYYIFVPDGTYNLGTTCLTTVSGYNISIVGQSMSGTIIKNAPTVANEGIGKTATLLITGQNVYIQDLTLQNALDYYNAGSAGRAVALQDKGCYTICKNVALKSYQDTYYSNNASGKFYFENSNIHGCVDFICGGGDVFFNGCTLTVEKRTSDGSGAACITAPYTQSTWGYVFSGCTISNEAASYSLGRAWGGTPRCAYLNTILSAPTKIASTRYTTAGMNVIADKFVEYNSLNTSGSVVSPSSNKLTFTYGSTSKTVETILTSTQAAAYALNKVFTSWSPSSLAAQVKMGSLSQSNGTITWSAVSGASSYAVFKDGSLVSILGSSTKTYTATATGTYTVRASNAMGGFGTAASVTVTSISSSSSSSTSSNLSPYDKNAPIGWASVDGSTTGGNNKNAVTVSTLADLTDALSGTDQATIYVKGTINFTGKVSIKDVQNKSIYGLPGSVLQNSTHTATVSKTGILSFSNCKNIIMRNLTFKAAGAYDIDGNDNLTLTNCDYMWVDHCDFQDGVDGNFDCNNGSNHVSVTWCRFHYLISPWAGGSGGSDDHRFSDLWGGSDKSTVDNGKLNTTFANCWWDEGCRERMPRVRFGKVHIVNCLYSSSVANYCVGAGYQSNIYVENTAFTSTKTQKTPWTISATSSGYKNYNITFKGCQGVTDLQSRSGSNAYYTPSTYYTITAMSASLVESVLTNTENGAGATLNITANSGILTAKRAVDSSTTGIESADDTASSDVVNTEIYSMSGEKANCLSVGLNIVKTIYANGSIKVTKVMVNH